MLNKRFWLGMALVFGFMAIGNLEAQSDNLLNGSWVVTLEETETEYKFDNGSFESTIDGVPMQRGVYTTDNGKITIDETHIHGGAIALLGISGLESKWYSKNEFIIAIRPVFAEYGLSDEQINETVYEMLSIASYTYSVDTDTLILGTDEGHVIILNKR